MKHALTIKKSLLWILGVGAYLIVLASIAAYVLSFLREQEDLRASPADVPVIPQLRREMLDRITRQVPLRTASPSAPELPSTEPLPSSPSPSPTP